MTTDIAEILAQTHPYDVMSPEEQAALAEAASLRDARAGESIYRLGEPLEALYLIVSGRIDITDGGGDILSILGPRNSFGERGLMKDGKGAVNATAAEDSRLIAIPAPVFHQLVKDHPRVLRFFDRTRPAAARRQDITTMALSELMTRTPLTCSPDTPLIEAARKMRGLHVSCIIATVEDAVRGILTTGDISARAVAEGRPADTPVSEVMTADPLTLPPTALVADVLHVMVERGITHMPVVEAGKLVGILTQTDLTRFQATSSAALIREIAHAPDPRHAGPDRRPHSRVAGATGRRTEPAPDGHAPDHRHRRCHHAPPAGFGRGATGRAARALPVACLRVAGPAGTDRCFGSGQLPDPRRRGHTAR
jgi:CBS domain-containing protein